PKPAAREKPVGRPRLSFNERHALATLPQKIEALREERAALEALLADPALYAKDPKKFAAAGARLEAAQIELAEAEERWLELEIRREEIDG
ncbi:MAG TPA: ABC transporter ATP-binding protein, partial [Methylocystis sp.]|nr:ABC transporter ATP-binding protein [Methylocystis sp.]